MMDETESLGKYLRRERESKKISLREVSKNTRVREHILRSIEEDRHDLLPSPTFVKGFLTAYAKYVGLDPNEVLLRYQNSLKSVLDAETDVQPRMENKSSVRQRWTMAGAIFGVVVAGLIVSYLFFLQPSKPAVESPPLKTAKKEPPAPPPALTQTAETQPLQAESPSAPAPASSQPVGSIPVAAPSQAGSIPAPAPPGPVERPLPQKGKTISLQLKAVEPTWLSIKTDNQTEREMTLRPGENVSFEAVNQMYLLIGNAGGLDLVYNGKPLERFGKSGEVVGLTFTPEGVNMKRFEKSKSQ